MSQQFDVDVHVLTLPDSNSVWLEQCLESLHREPCNVYVVEGVKGHLGLSRIKGYSLGSAPFVSFVDCDDYVLPGVIDACLETIKADLQCSAVITKEKILRDGNLLTQQSFGGHHLYLAKRSCIELLFEDFKQHQFIVDGFTRDKIRPKLVDFVGYVWRSHANGFHHQYPLRREVHNE